MKNSSIFKNGIYSLVATAFNIVTPLVIYPSVLRALGATSYGKVSFAETLVSYFVILATLGINNYAQRECAVCRDNQELFNIKVTGIIKLSALTTFISVSAYFFVVLLNDELRIDIALYAVFAVMIISSGLKFEWFYSSLERFDLTSIRNILGKALLLVGSLTFINNPDDYLIYAIIIVVSSSLLPLILNYVGILSNNITHFHIVRNVSLKPLIKPITLLSLVTLGSKLFSSMDITLLRILTDEQTVGIYSASALLPQMLDEFLMVIAGIITPRLFIYVNGNNEIEMKELLRQTSNAMFFVVFPAIATCAFFSEELLYIFAGNSFVTGAESLRLYSIIMFTTMCITLAGTRMYIARKKEAKLFILLLSAAGLNAVLDIILINRFGMIGATIATVISNVYLLVIELTLERTWQYLFSKDILKYVLAIIPVCGIFCISRTIDMQNTVLKLFISIAVAG
ncbi:MAG TPA: oligosaccharide flippase family protein, partial [Spirochaetales bacterium]|nr:oligosaccharide flippase family protein [Spirochaetales bacterium]